ncbi:MAG: hypothetical protein IJE15_01005 [Bacteroidaceae bacterium]|nr:hypothetical protein [Bacteroidaceae bacterium]
MNKRITKLMAAVALMLTAMPNGVQAQNNVLIENKVDMTNAVTRNCSSHTIQWPDESTTTGWRTNGWGRLYVGRYNMAKVKQILVRTNIKSHYQYCYGMKVFAAPTTASAEAITTSDLLDEFTEPESNRIGNFYGDEKIDGNSLDNNMPSNTWKAGPQYCIDLDKKTITIDEDDFQDMWGSGSMAVATTTGYTYNDENKTDVNNTYNTAFNTGFTTTTGIADIFLNFGALKWGEMVIDEVIVVTEESAERVIIAPGVGVKVLDVENFVANNNDVGTHNLYYNDNSKGECVYTNQNARFFYMGRFDVDNIKAIRICGNLIPASSKATSISVNFYDTTEETIDATYMEGISRTLRDGKHTFFNIYGGATLNNGSTSMWNSGFKRGPFYTADFTAKTVTVDVAAFREYWNDQTAAVNLTQTWNEGTNSATTGFTDNTATGEKDLFLVFAAQNGRAGVSDIVVYMTDGSTVTVPVTSMTAGITTTDATASLAPSVLASSYLNTTGETVSAATLGDVTLTADNIAAFTTLADANVNVTAASASYELTVTDAKASTLTLPFEAELPDGIKAYELNHTAGEATATATSVNEITANQPVLINAEADTYSFTATDVAIAPAAAGQGALTGVYATTDAPVGSYVLQNGTAGVGFYKVAEGKQPSVKPFRAYLTAGTEAQSLSIVYRGDGETDIESVDGEPQTVNQVYDLSGRRVANPTKGLYIVNGKKQIIK